MIIREITHLVLRTAVLTRELIPYKYVKPRELHPILSGAPLEILLQLDYSWGLPSDRWGAELLIVRGYNLSLVAVE